MNKIWTAKSPLAIACIGAINEPAFNTYSFFLSMPKFFKALLIHFSKAKYMAMGVVMTITSLWQAKADNNSSVNSTNLQQSLSPSLTKEGGQRPDGFARASINTISDDGNTADIDPRYYTKERPFSIPKLTSADGSAPEYRVSVMTGADTYLTVDGMDPGTGNRERHTAPYDENQKTDVSDDILNFTAKDAWGWSVRGIINWVPKTIVVHLNASCEITTLPEPILKPGETPYKNVFRTAKSTPITLNTKWNMAYYRREDEKGTVLSDGANDSTKVVWAGTKIIWCTMDRSWNAKWSTKDPVYICAFPEVESASRTITLPITNIWVTYTLKSKATWEVIGTILGNGQDQSFTSLKDWEYELFTQVGEDQPEACPSALIIKDVSGINEVSATGTLLHRLSGSTFGSTEEVAYKVYSAEGRVLAQGTGSVIYIKGDSNFVIIKYCRTNSNHQTYIQKFTVR